MTVRLSELVDGVETREIIGDDSALVSDLTIDSRKAAPGSLFACVKGSRADGRDFVGDALTRGATVVLTDRSLGQDVPATQVVVADVRRALAAVAARFFGKPSERLRVVGVTGTNGKTTTVHYVGAVVEASGCKAGIMGTLGHRIGDAVRKDVFTTPESIDVQRYLGSMVDAGARYCIMEVSSHAIALGRVNEVAFDTVGFTNLTRDHLDFHRDFSDYKRTKMKLFGIDDAGLSFGAARRAAINLDDPTGVEIASLSPLPKLTFAFGSRADVRADTVRMDASGVEMRVASGGETFRLATRLPGRVNAENALAACAISMLLGFDTPTIARGIESLCSMPGRMELIRGGGRQAMVDYAHTPDALRRLLAGVKEFHRGRLICVFGCGGDRDRGKRPEMGRIVGEMADVAIVTSDNPRTEDPLRIIEDIVRGLPSGCRYEVIPDRAEAIRRAVALSDEGDLIVIAGKGHEDYQIIGDKRTHFDDREVARRALGATSDARA